MLLKIKLMKYKLLKDLPTYPAGTECHLSKKWNLVSTEDGLVIYAKSTLDKFPNILTDWFEPIPEKVKPKAVPEDGDGYYYINPRWDISYDNKCSDIQSVIDQWHWRWTSEEAEQEVAKRAAIERVRRYLVENDLLETDMTKWYYTVVYIDNMHQLLSQEFNSNSVFVYSPYGRIKNTSTKQFLKDCRDDLLLVHS